MKSPARECQLLAVLCISLNDLSMTSKYLYVTILPRTCFRISALWSFKVPFSYFHKIWFCVIFHTVLYLTCNLTSRDHVLADFPSYVSWIFKSFIYLFYKMMSVNAGFYRLWTEMRIFLRTTVQQSFIFVLGVTLFLIIFCMSHYN